MQGEGSGPNLLPPLSLALVDRVPEGEKFEAVMRDAAAQGRPAMVILTGLPGVGKTALATHLCYGVKDEFFDAQLYYDLGGSSANGPAEPTEVLKHFLLRLKVPHGEIPASEAERAAAFRAETAGKRFLVFLDDAATLAQLRPLLPSSPHCVVVVTSRMKLTEAKRDGFVLLPLEPFEDEFALELITRSVDAEVLNAEPEARDQLLKLCGGLPLTLSVFAAMLDTPAPHLSRRLKKALAGSPLDAYVADPAMSIRAIFTLSYRERPVDQARAYRLLASHPGAGFSLSAAAALLDVEDEGEVLDLLLELVDATLLEAGTDGRFGFHDLVRSHAYERLVEEVQEQERRDAAHRIVRWYAHRTIALVQALYRRWWATELFGRIPADRSVDALAELETERGNLLAAVLLAKDLKFDEILPAFCEALSHWYYETGRVADQAETQEIGLAAAERAHDRVAEMRLRNQRGTAYEAAGDFELSLDQFTRSLRLATELGHVLGEQSATEWIGIVLGALGRIDEAIDALKQSLRIAERITDPEQRDRAVALTRFHIARLLVGADRAAELDAEVLNSVLKYFHEHNEPVNEARTLTSLAKLCGEAELAQAVPMLERAVELFASRNVFAQQALALRELADVEDRLGDHASALAHRDEADELTGRAR